MQQKILREMLALPTAPFAEHFVVDYIKRFCAHRKHIETSCDAAGNFLVRVRLGKRHVKRPVCIAAHLDHPGFVVDRMILRGRVRAFWRGGVPPEYFVGTGVRFFVEGNWRRGSIRSVKTVSRDGRQQVDTAVVEMDSSQEVPPGSIGMWDLPDPRIRGRRMYARGCDDIAGAAALLCCIDVLVRRTRSCDAYFLFTRAEEVGFVGAIAAARRRTIPPRCFVVAMETSSELASAKMGDGPILRVGDRASSFTPAATAYCHRIARELALSDSRFQYQRKLMDGGTCESSAYCVLGYEATGMCIALGNYHNIDRKRQTIRSEYIHLGDFDNVVRWFVELARAPHPYTGRDEPLRAQIDQLERRYRTRLRQSRRKPC